MKRHTRTTFLALLLALVLTACSAAPTAVTTTAAPETTAVEAASPETTAPHETESAAQAGTDVPVETELVVVGAGGAGLAAAIAQTLARFKTVRSTRRPTAPLSARLLWPRCPTR